MEKDTRTVPEGLWADDHLNSLVPETPIDRRSFIAAAIAAGFAVTAEPVLAQAIKTPMDGLEGGDVKVGDIPAYYAWPRRAISPCPPIRTSESASCGRSPTSRK